MLTLRVEVDGQVPAHVAQELHRSKPWASYWLDRYNKEGIEGLKDRPKCGRTPHLPSEIVSKIRKKLTESKQGWSTEQLNDMIVEESGIQYHYTHVYRLIHQWGFKQKVPRKVHVNTASEEEKEQFKKRAQEILDNLHEGFTAVSLDESFFFFDSLVRKVWIEENSRPIVAVTGSHRHFCMFGAMSLDRKKQLFRQYDRFDENTFYEFLKQLHYKFPKCYVFLDKASQLYKSHKVRQYFEKHNDNLVPVWLPIASPEFMVLEESWNISKICCY